MVDNIETFLIDQLKGLNKDDISSVVDRANIIYEKLDNLDNTGLDTIIKSLKDKDFNKLNDIFKEE